MSKSLQDQLLALGLAKTKAPKAPQQPPAKQAAAGQQAAFGKPFSEPKLARKPSARPARPLPKPGSESDSRPDSRLDENISLEQAYRIREAAEKSAKQRARERKLEDDRNRAELNRQIRQVIDNGRLNLPDAAEARYFMYKARIRKVHVSPEQLAGLNSGKLGVVYLAGGYHILASEHIEEVKRLSPAHVPDLLSGGDDDPFDEADFAADSAGDPDNDAATVPDSAGESPNTS